jgi:hypothetical protein
MKEKCAICAYEKELSILNASAPYYCVTVKINHLLCRWREDL